jgi:hypothetical protein
MFKSLFIHNFIKWEDSLTTTWNLEIKKLVLYIVEKLAHTNTK